MQKGLLSVILALFMALAVVGVRNTVVSSSSNHGVVLMAEGGAPVPPDTMSREGGAPVPPDTMHREGGAPVPPDTFREGGAPVPPDTRF